MSAVEIPITRRAALQGIAGLVIGVYLPRGLRAASAAPPNGAPFAPNAFVRIGTDNIVTVLIKHIEFGQGPFTGLATLVDAAARAWGVPASEITVERGVLRHARTKRQGRFGQFAEAAARLPVPSNVKLKDPSAFRFVGKDGAVKKLDAAAKTNGKTQFTLDIRERGMLTVVVARPPRFGARVTIVDVTDARAVRGVIDVRQIPTGVAVYADGFWPAVKARDRLGISWDESGAERRGSEQIITEYRALAR